MKKTILTSVMAGLIAMPAVAEITTGATCDTANLGQSENNSTANVEADWTANTININWYIDEDAQTALTTNTCTYDGIITLPTEPTKTGYTFSGWKLREYDGCSQILNQGMCEMLDGCVWSDDKCTTNQNSQGPLDLLG